MSVPDRYTQLTEMLHSHSVLVGRREAKRLAIGHCYGDVLPARETFVVEQWMRSDWATYTAPPKRPLP